jgi:hypothetical protein
MALGCNDEVGWARDAPFASEAEISGGDDGRPQGIVHGQLSRHRRSCG